MKNKLNISYTITEDEIFLVFQRLVQEKEPGLDALMDSLDSYFHRADTQSVLSSILNIREKLLDFDLRLGEVSAMLDEYSRKKEKTEE